MELFKTRLKSRIEFLAIALFSVLAGLLVSLNSFASAIIIFAFIFFIFSLAKLESVLIILVLYIPFQIALNIASGIDLASARVAIVLLFAIWAVKSLFEKKMNIAFSMQTILISVFLLFATLSVFWAFEDERALRKILVFVSIFPLYFLVSSFESKKYAYKILDALFLGGFIISLVGLIQFAAQFVLGIDSVMDYWAKTIAPVFYGNEFAKEVVANPSWLVNVNGVTVLRVFSLFPDPHMFSFYVGLIIPLALSFALFCRDERKEKNLIFGNKRVVFCIFLIMLFAEILTFSRGGYVGMVAGIGTTILLSWRYFSLRKKFFLGSFFAVFFLMILASNPAFLSRFLSSFDFNEGSNSERIKNWSQGYEVFADNFLAGVGIGNYSYEIRPSADYRTPIYAHNMYLDVGAEMGIFALIVWILLFYVSIVQLYNYGRGTTETKDKALSFGLIGSFVWFSAHSFFDTAIYSPTVLAVLMVILALSATISGKSVHNEIK